MRVDGICAGCTRTVGHEAQDCLISLEFSNGRSPGYTLASYLVRLSLTAHQLASSLSTAKVDIVMRSASGVSTYSRNVFVVIE